MGAISKQSMEYSGTLPDGWYPTGSLNPQKDGYFTAVADGTTGEVFSCNLDGTLTKAEKGSAGPNELCGVVNGNVLTFHPTNDVVHTFKFMPDGSVPGWQ